MATETTEDSLSPVSVRNLAPEQQWGRSGSGGQRGGGEIPDPARTMEAVAPACVSRRFMLWLESGLIMYQCRSA